MLTNNKKSDLTLNGNDKEDLSSLAISLEQAAQANFRRFTEKFQRNRPTKKKEDKKAYILCEFDRIIKDYPDLAKLWRGERIYEINLFSGFQSMISKNILDWPILNGYEYPEEIFFLLVDKLISKKIEQYRKGSFEIPSKSFLYLNRHYKVYIDLLLEGTKEQGPIIEVYKGGMGKCRSYRFTEKYAERRSVSYIIKDKKIRKKILYDEQKKFVKQSKMILDNVHALNRIESYPKILLPTIETIKKRAMIYVKKIVPTKGKDMIFRRTFNKMLDEKVEKVRLKKKTFDIKEIKFTQEKSLRKLFVIAEDGVNAYKHLLKKGLRLPNIQASGRIDDSFTNIPSWIRPELKIDGEKIVEVDVATFHPKLLVKIAKAYKFSDSEVSKINRHLYGDVYQEIADVVHKPREKIKKEFLSFLNCKNYQMINYHCFIFFKTKLPKLIELIQKIKSSDHTQMSKLLCNLESTIMHEAIMRCKRQIKDFAFFGVYDGIGVKKSIAEKVQNIIDSTLAEYEVSTNASFKKDPLDLM